MTNLQPNNPLHGLTLEQILKTLVERLGWDELGRRVSIRCFNHEPSITSSLRFLRRNPWAREQVESLYLETGRTTSRPDGKSGPHSALTRVDT